MWFSTNPGATVSFGNGARYVGTVYGPGNGAHGGTDIKFGITFKVHGGLVCDIDFLNIHTDTHFGEALGYVDPIAGYAQSNSTATNMDITLNQFNASSR